MSGRSRQVVVVPVADADRLAAVCTLARVRAQVVPVPGAGCVLLTADGGEEAAARLSRLVQGADVVVLTAGEGVVGATSWHGGRRGADPRAGLLLSTWPDAVQGLLLGGLDPDEVEGTRPGGEGPRWRAAWRLARSRRS